MNAVDLAKRVIEDAKVLEALEDIEVPVVPKVATAKTDAMGKDSVVRVAREVLKVRKATEVATDAMGKVFVVHVVLVGQKVRKEIKATEVAKEKKEILVVPVKPCAVRKDVVDLVGPEVLKGREALRGRGAATEKVFVVREVPKDLKEILAVPVRQCAALVDLAGKKDLEVALDLADRADLGGLKVRKDVTAEMDATENPEKVFVALVVRVVHAAPRVLEAREGLKDAEVNEALREKTVATDALEKKGSRALKVALDRVDLREKMVAMDATAKRVLRAAWDRAESVDLREKTVAMDATVKKEPRDALVRVALVDLEVLPVRKVAMAKTAKMERTENVEPRESAVRTVRTLAQLSNTLFAKPRFPLRKTTRQP